MCRSRTTPRSSAGSPRASAWTNSPGATRPPSTTAEGNRTIAYTIVAGDALDRPSGARSVTHGGVKFYAFNHDGRPVVTWERGGHTCVLSSAAVRPTELFTLADWRGKGAIPF